MDNYHLEQILEIAKEASFNEDRLKSFLGGLEENVDLYFELEYFLDNNDFLCKTKVNGFSIVDIMVWQIDHFRAFLDRDTTLTRNNPGTMVLLAIETMMEMKVNPEKYIQSYGQETGTDRIV